MQNVYAIPAVIILTLFLLKVGVLIAIFSEKWRVRFLWIAMAIVCVALLVAGQGALLVTFFGTFALHWLFDSLGNIFIHNKNNREEKE